MAKYQYTYNLDDASYQVVGESSTDDIDSAVKVIIDLDKIKNKNDIDIAFQIIMQKILANNFVGN